MKAKGATMRLAVVVFVSIFSVVISQEIDTCPIEENSCYFDRLCVPVMNLHEEEAGTCTGVVDTISKLTNLDELLPAIGLQMDEMSQRIELQVKELGDFTNILISEGHVNQNEVGASKEDLLKQLLGDINIDEIRNSVLKK